MGIFSEGQKKADLRRSIEMSKKLRLIFWLTVAQGILLTIFSIFNYTRVLANVLPIPALALMNFIIWLIMFGVAITDSIMILLLFKHDDRFLIAGIVLLVCTIPEHLLMLVLDIRAVALVAFPIATRIFIIKKFSQGMTTCLRTIDYSLSRSWDTLVGVYTGTAITLIVVDFARRYLFKTALFSVIYIAVFLLGALISAVMYIVLLRRSSTVMANFTPEPEVAKS